MLDLLRDPAFGPVLTSALLIGVGLPLMWGPGLDRHRSYRRAR